MWDASNAWDAFSSVAASVRKLSSFSFRAYNRICQAGEFAKQLEDDISKEMDQAPVQSSDVKPSAENEEDGPSEKEESPRDVASEPVQSLPVEAADPAATLDSIEPLQQEVP